MQIHNVPVDMERAAHDIALVFVNKAAETEDANGLDATTDLFQVYLNAYVRIMSIDPDAAEALLR